MAEVVEALLDAGVDTTNELFGVLFIIHGPYGAARIGLVRVLSYLGGPDLDDVEATQAHLVGTWDAVPYASRPPCVATLRRAIRDLEADGWLVVHRSPGRTHRYHLQFPDWL